MASQARVAALRLLTRRDYTARELREKLLDREVPEPDISTVLADLTAEGLVNDRRVAESFVRVASGVKGRGRQRIARELEQRGVDRVVVRDVLAGLPVEDEVASIRKMLARKRLPARLDAAEHRRIFGQLLRRGFSADLIAKALKGRGSEEE
jgi:regulatory protein